MRIPVKPPPSRPTSVLAKRISDIFHRSHQTKWLPKEIKAFLLIKDSITNEALLSNERRYKTLWPPNRDKNTLRHDLYTWLNNFTTETDRANAWCDAHPEKKERKVIPINLPNQPRPALTNEELQEIERFNNERAERSAFRRAKKEMGR